ncbi:MAG: arylsulfatase [Aristaeellaceae bacterium]
MSCKQPNVVFVLTDDQGYGDLGCTGNPYIHTPQIDAFYADAVRMTDYHVAPLCAPTRGALFSGHRPLRNGVWATCWGRSILHENEVTIAEVFRRNGYATGLFGKWHLGDNYPYRPQDRGFETVLAHKGGGVGQTPDFWGNNYFDDVYFANGQPTPCEGYCTDVWFDAAERFIQAHMDTPFFACITTNAPHEPYLVPERYAAPYRGNSQIVHPEFYGMIANIDENFGRLRQKLSDWGIEDNTILIFMTDNGSSGCSELDENEHVLRGYNANMRGMKTSYYDGGHRVPFFIRWPQGGLQGGRDVDDTAFHVDFFPTMVDLCGLTMEPLQLDGVSLKKALVDGERLPEGRAEFMQYHQSTLAPDKWTSAVVCDKWRLVRGRELYNITDDPGQRHDIAAQHPDVVARLRQAHEEYWTEMQDTMGVYAAIYLGDPHENPTRLDAMDVMGDVAWSQIAVALAQRSAGKWHVKFTRPGRYCFTLQRWPRELNLPMDAQPSVEELQQLALYKDAMEYWAERGGPEALRLVQAGVSFFGQTHVQMVEPSDTCAACTLRVEQTGETDLEAWFADAQGERLGAYYVYVQRLHE